jgi:hypothetical protein
VDLGGNRSIGEVRWLVSESVAGVTMTIQVSSDRQSWTDVASISGFAAGEWRSVETDQSGRYVRFLFANPDGAPLFGFLAEVEVAP